MAARLRDFALTMLVAVACVVCLETAAWACPTCKESLAQSDPARANMVRGYFWSILFMMSMPFLILSGMATLFWWEIRKAKLQKLREAAAMPRISSVVETRQPVEV